MQHNRLIDYSKNPTMRWLTPKMQKILNTYISANGKLNISYIINNIKED